MERKKAGFTLVELVVVIMILGILAGVAAPRFLNVSSQATDNGLKQTLGVLRNAVEVYSANNGGDYPDASSTANFEADMQPYLRAGLPKSPVGTKDNTITTGSTADDTTAWMMDPLTGNIIANCTDTDTDGTAYSAY